MVIEKTSFSQIFDQKTTDMKLFYTILIIGISTLLLLTAGTLTRDIPLHIHPNAFVNGMIRYQASALIIAILATIAVLLLNPSGKQFLSIGQLNVMAGKERWLGINGRSTWTINGFQLLFFISTATAIFMFLGVKYTNSLNNFQWSFIPFILLFSFTNALSEELIFRFGVMGGLYNEYSKLMILLVSAVLFGIPHYWGYPSGVIGVLMSGVLGYILCKVTYETKGIAIPWTIHFVQDVIIFTALFMMNVKQNNP